MTRFQLVAVDVPRIVGGVLLLAGITVNFANVIGRYFFGSPIFWAEEAMVYLSVWTIFVAMIAVTAARAHLSMDLVYNALPEAPRRLVANFITVVAVATLGFICWNSWQVIAKLSTLGMRSISLDIPMVIPHLAILTGFSLSAVALVAGITRTRR